MEYSRPLILSERAELMPMKHEDYGLIIGMAVLVNPRS